MGTPNASQDISDAELEELLSDLEPEETEVATETGTTEVATKKATSGLRTFINQAQLEKDISFKDTDVQSAFMNQASLFVNYAQKAHQARLQADSAKHKIDVLESVLDGEIRREAQENNLKMTEGAITSAIKSNDRHIKATKVYLEAKMIADLCKDVTEAFRHRRDMLIQFGADQRQERQGELNLRSLPESPSARASRLVGSEKEA